MWTPTPSSALRHGVQVALASGIRSCSSSPLSALASAQASIEVCSGLLTSFVCSIAKLVRVLFVAIRLRRTDGEQGSRLCCGAGVDRASDVCC